MSDACNKKSFETASDATLALKLIKKNSSREKIPIRYYKCEKCGMIHLTAQPPSLSKGSIKVKTLKQKIQVQKSRKKTKWLKNYEINGEDDN